MKAIETRYKGYRFRSRLEARWAVFFDALEIQWEYESAGYRMRDGTHYLPDFWLPQVSMYAEVKPTAFTADELAKCRMLSDESGYPVLLLDGAPDLRSYWACSEGGYVDYCLFEGHKYWLTEHRFFSCCSVSWPEVERFDGDRFGSPAVEAARSARFEHGESGAPQVSVPPARRIPSPEEVELLEREKAINARIVDGVPDEEWPEIIRQKTEIRKRLEKINRGRWIRS